MNKPSKTQPADLADRIRGSLLAACTADALGAPTEERSPTEILELFGGRVTQFFPPPPDSPYAKGREAGQITDDSSQLLLFADALIEGEGVVTPERMAQLLIEWSGDSRYFPHFAGPTTQAAIERLASGDDPWEVGKSGRIMSHGASNGAAMRVAPAGLAHAGDLDGAINAAYLSCVPSHHTNLGVAGACAIAAATAVALTEKATVLDVVRAARTGAIDGDRLGSRTGRVVPGPSMIRRIELAVEAAMGGANWEVGATNVTELTGVGLPAVEAVPAAIGIFVAVDGNPWDAAIAAANAGGDSDTIGCMAASISGALSGPESIPTEIVETVLAKNELDLEPTVAGLLRLNAPAA